MASAKTNLVMTVIGFVVSTLFIVFICTRLICARIQLRASRRNFRRHFASSRSNLSTLERGVHGVDPPIVANFPAKKYGDAYFSSAESGQCSICLAEYHKEDVLRILPYCGHYFHIKCIDIWLLQHCTCPVCRISLRETSEKKRSMQLMSSSRSHLDTSLQAISPRHCRYLSTTPEIHRPDPIQEDQLLSRVGIQTTRGNTQLAEENGIIKDSTDKHIESPSFP
ncbi:RING-H2 finger protein ATL38-like [Chenopodium quinoa]|uniref:RING-type domain-containing protein n=1 Tax=Chenopodium quinoa TaxID=63459 RepID=A0A803NEW8_CHEQI|nr:RING-H2 finger protein ATL38-like [Chenopodium quinoa]